MSRSKIITQQESLHCPFCKKGEIIFTHTLDWYSKGRAHAAGRSAMIPKYHPEKIEIHNKCPNCGKSKRELKDAIEKGSSENLTHEERIKRLKDAGIPTKF